jgi:hypothetical protein
MCYEPYGATPLYTYIDDVYYLREPLHTTTWHTHRETQVSSGGTRADRQGPAVRGSPRIISGALVGLFYSEERGLFRRYVVGG